MEIERLKGKRFINVFDTKLISYFSVRGYDKDRAMVLTTVHNTVNGDSFDDEIEERYFWSAFSCGDYRWIDDMDD